LRGQRGQQLRDRLETPRGSVDADNREGHWITRPR
jgi:hypothetical protein